MKGIPIPIVNDNTAHIHHSAHARVTNLYEQQRENDSMQCTPPVSLSPTKRKEEKRKNAPLAKRRHTRKDNHVDDRTQTHRKGADEQRLCRVMDHRCPDCGP